MGNAELVKKAADTIKEMETKITDLTSKLRSYEKKEEATKLASELVTKNLLDRDNAPHVVEEWIEGNKDLNTIREAAKIAEYRPSGSMWDGLETPSDGSGNNPDDKFINAIMNG